MARPKKPSLILTTLDQCTEQMARLLTATLDLEVLTAEKDLAVAAASAQFEKLIDDRRTAKADIEAALQLYYMTHLAELEKDGRRSFTLPNGVMGRRLSPSALTTLKNYTWGAVKVLVRATFGDKYFRIAEPELDKDQIKAELNADALHKCGMQLKQDEKFYAEPSRLPDPATVGGAK